MKLTEKGKEILQTIKELGICSASDISKKLTKIDPATIYRNLEKFNAEKLIKKVHVSENETKYEILEKNHHHAVCNDCEKVIHIKAPDDKIIKSLNLKNFDIEELEIIVKGKCKS